MYCLSCGGAVTPGLRYCNHCGARLDAAKGDNITNSSEVKPETLVWAMIAVFVFGLGGIIGLMGVMTKVFDQRENLGLIISFTLLSFLIMIAVEGVLVGMLLGRNRNAKKAGDSERLNEQAGKDLGDVKSRVLPEPALSVTEHTTRTLEPVGSQRNTE
jgi:hypothetical protein